MRCKAWTTLLAQRSLFGRLGGVYIVRASQLLQLHSQPGPRARQNPKSFVSGDPVGEVRPCSSGNGLDADVLVCRAWSRRYIDRLSANVFVYLSIYFHSKTPANMATSDSKRASRDDEKLEHWVDTEDEKADPNSQKVDYSGAALETSPEEVKLVNKLDWRIMPCLWSMYFLYVTMCDRSLTTGN